MESLNRFIQDYNGREYIYDVPRGRSPEQMLCDMDIRLKKMEDAIMRIELFLNNQVGDA